MTDETQGPIICGENVVAMNWGRDHVLIDDPLGRICIPLTDAAAVAAAIMTFAGAPDATALVDRLVEALEDRDGGSHDSDCKVYRNDGFAFCNCGHLDARAALTEARAWRREGKA